MLGREKEEGLQLESDKEEFIDVKKVAHAIIFIAKLEAEEKEKFDDYIASLPAVYIIQGQYRADIKEELKRIFLDEVARPRIFVPVREALRKIYQALEHEYLLDLHLTQYRIQLDEQLITHIYENKDSEELKRLQRCYAVLDEDGSDLFKEKVDQHLAQLKINFQRFVYVGRGSLQQLKQRYRSLDAMQVFEAHKHELIMQVISPYSEEKTRSALQRLTLLDEAADETICQAWVEKYLQWGEFYVMPNEIITGIFAFAPDELGSLAQVNKPFCGLVDDAVLCDQIFQTRYRQLLHERSKTQGEKQEEQPELPTIKLSDLASLFPDQTVPFFHQKCLRLAMFFIEYPELLSNPQQCEEKLATQLIRYFQLNEVETWLAKAAANNDMRLVTFLLALGAKPDLEPEEKKKSSSFYVDYKPPLYCAVEKGNREIALLLLKAGAKADETSMIANHNGFLPLYLATKKRDIVMMTMLLDHGSATQPKGGHNRFYPLYAAVENGHVEAAQLLFKRGAKARILNPGGQNPVLVESAKANGFAVVLLAISQGAKCNIRDMWGNSLLHVACEQNNTDAIKFFVDKGVSVHEKNDNHLFPIEVLISHTDNLEAVDYLVEHGADLSSPTLLTIAIREGKEEIAMYLIRKGANTKEVGSVEIRPFAEAIKNQRHNLYFLEKFNAISQKFSHLSDLMEIMRANLVSSPVEILKIMHATYPEHLVTLIEEYREAEKSAGWLAQFKPSSDFKKYVGDEGLVCLEEIRMKHSSYTLD